ncbi:MAG TPA: ABC transporter substrate-binding protein [Pilimelia sp.]|nr:ABC transporter substrate-binding protein [Pilimelia sp.]
MMRRMPRLLPAALAVLALAVTGGCAGDGADGTTEPGGDARASAATFPVTVGKITLAERPEKIVALSPTATEMLFAIGAGSQVTAVDSNSNHPPEAPKTDLSGFQPNAEAIAAKKPDLVIISNDLNKIVDQLTQLKIPVYLASAAVTLADSYRQIGDLGALTGHRDEAGALTERMKSDIAKLVKDAPQPADKLTYFYELGTELYSATSKTFIGSLFSMVGLVNIADPADADGTKGGYPQLSEEAILKADPDLIFLADTKCCKQSPATVKARPGWATVNAVRAGNVVGLDDDIASRWGPRVVELLRTIVDAVARAGA